MSADEQVHELYAALVAAKAKPELCEGGLCFTLSAEADMGLQMAWAEASIEIQSAVVAMWERG